MIPNDARRAGLAAGLVDEADLLAWLRLQIERSHLAADAADEYNDSPRVSLAMGHVAAYEAVVKYLEEQQ